MTEYRVRYTVFGLPLHRDIAALDERQAWAQVEASIITRSYDLLSVEAL